MPKPSLPPDQFELEATAVDIKSASCGAATCPIAQAARRIFQLPARIDYCGFPAVAMLSLSLDDGSWRQWVLCAGGKEFASRFDQGIAVRPGKFKAVRVTS